MASSLQQSKHKLLNRPPVEGPAVDNTGVLSQPWQNWFWLLQKYFITQQIKTVDINPGSVAANTTEEESFSSLNLGILSSDYILKLIKPTHTAGFSIGNLRVTGNDAIAVQFINNTGSAIDPGNETYTIIWMKG